MKVPNLHPATGRINDVARESETGFGLPLHCRRQTRDTERASSACANGLATRQKLGCTTFDFRLSFGGRVMIKEHDCIVLATDLPKEGLVVGDIGTVVHVHQGGAGYEVEFMTLTGQTVAIVTLLAGQVRSANQRELAHTRELQAA